MGALTETPQFRFSQRSTDCLGKKNRENGLAGLKNLQCNVLPISVSCSTSADNNARPADAIPHLIASHSRKTVPGRRQRINTIRQKQTGRRKLQAPGILY
jgi:hypothetical protein